VYVAVALFDFDTFTPVTLISACFLILATVSVIFISFSNAEYPILMLITNSVTNIDIVLIFISLFNRCCPPRAYVCS